VVKPVVDRLQRRWAGRLTVVRVEVQTPAGRRLSREWRVEQVPTFVLLDATGRERWRRTGWPPDDRLLADWLARG